MSNRFYKLIAALIVVSVMLAASPVIPGRQNSIKTEIRADGTISATLDPDEEGFLTDIELTSEDAATVDKAGASLKKHFQNFDKKFTLNFDKPYKASNSNDAYDFFHLIRDKALEHTGKPTEGDFLRWTISSMSYSSAMKSDGIHFVTIEVKYNMTKTQKSEAVKKADSILDSLKLSGKSAKDKIKAIYDYVTKNVKYDYDAKDGVGISYSAYGAICKKKAVCQGISLEIYYMMLKSGIDCRLVAGYLPGARHGWNIVKLNGLYYHVDATNDLGKNKYDYFLKCYKSMKPHVMDYEYQSDDFEKKYPPATLDYGAKPSPTPTKNPLPTPKNIEYTLKDKGNLTAVCGDRVFLYIPESSVNYAKWTSTNPDVYEPLSAGFAEKAGHTTVTVTYTDMTVTDSNGDFPERTRSVDITVLYKDVIKESDFWYAPTNYLTAKDVVKGYENQTLFKPGNDCTRAQMLTFMWRLAGSPNPKSKTCQFTDVKEGEYYYKPVLWAVENGITTGYDDGTFRPKTVCTRAQTVTFLWRMAGKPSPKSSTNNFKDVKTTDYFYKATLWASEKKILAGYDDGTFRPQGLCLRRQMVTFLYKYDKYVNNK